MPETAGSGGQDRITDSAADRPIGEIAHDALVRAVSSYTVAPENVERVIGLVTDDVMAAVRVRVESDVRWFYQALVAQAEKGRCDCGGL